MGAGGGATGVGGLEELIKNFHRKTMEKRDGLGEQDFRDRIVLVLRTETMDGKMWTGYVEDC
jgi:hypothetical protein